MPLAEREVLMLKADITRAMIEALAMQAENQNRIQQGFSIAYTEESFDKVITDNGIGYNQVIERLNRAEY